MTRRARSACQLKKTNYTIGYGSVQRENAAKFGIVSKYKLIYMSFEISHIHIHRLLKVHVFHVQCDGMVYTCGGGRGGGGEMRKREREMRNREERERR